MSGCGGPQITRDRRTRYRSHIAHNGGNNNYYRWLYARYSTRMYTYDPNFPPLKTVDYYCNHSDRVIVFLFFFFPSFPVVYLRSVVYIIIPTWRFILLLLVVTDPQVYDTELLPMYVLENIINARIWILYPTLYYCKDTCVVSIRSHTTVLYNVVCMSLKTVVQYVIYNQTMINCFHVTLNRLARRCINLTSENNFFKYNRINWYATIDSHITPGRRKHR